MEVPVAVSCLSDSSTFLGVDRKLRQTDLWSVVKFGSRFVWPTSGEHSGAQWFWLMIDVVRTLMMLTASVWQTGVCYPDRLCWIVRGKGDLHRPERRQRHESDWLQEVKSRTYCIKSTLSDAGCRANCKWYRYCPKCDTVQLRCWTLSFTAQTVQQLMEWASERESKRKWVREKESETAHCMRAVWTRTGSNESLALPPWQNNSL